MIAVIDYCKGNLKSVERGLTHVGGDAHITDDPEVIRTADALVLPGVGSFADASATMQQTGQMEAIRAALAKGTPFLGICLGEHLLFEGGTEHAEHGHECLVLVLSTASPNACPRKTAQARPTRFRM